MPPVWLTVYMYVQSFAVLGCRNMMVVLTHEVPGRPIVGHCIPHALGRLCASNTHLFAAFPDDLGEVAYGAWRTKAILPSSLYHIQHKHGKHGFALLRFGFLLEFSFMWMKVKQSQESTETISPKQWPAAQSCALVWDILCVSQWRKQYTIRTFAIPLVVFEHVIFDFAVPLFCWRCP